MPASIQWILGSLVVATAIWLFLWANPSSRVPPVARTERSPENGRFPNEQNQEPQE
jgi:hypothetical protein